MSSICVRNKFQVVKSLCVYLKNKVSYSEYASVVLKAVNQDIRARKVNESLSLTLEVRQFWFGDSKMSIRKVGSSDVNDEIMNIKERIVKIFKTFKTEKRERYNEFRNANVNTMS